jgi:hypothetical protein
MLLLEGYISNFTRARYYFLCVEFSDFYVNQSLAGQTIPPVNFCSDENIQTIFGTKLEDFLNYRINYNSIS